MEHETGESKGVQEGAAGGATGAKGEVNVRRRNVTADKGNTRGREMVREKNGGVEGG